MLPEPDTLPPGAGVTGDPNVIRLLQAMLDMARSGKIIGVSMVAITADGAVAESNALPPNPSMIYIAIGAMTSQIATLTNLVKTFAQKQAPSSILRPFR